MSRRALYVRSSAIALASLLAAASLWGCNKAGGDADVSQAAAGPALPLTTAEAPLPQRAPPVQALPAAAPAPVTRVQDPEDAYAYLDQAYYQGDAFEDAPPDYSFDYDGTSPWVWRSADDALEFVEPVGGGYRCYYYQPGAAYPYLVRDEGYSYGFDGPDLVVIYDSYGRVLPRYEIDRRAPEAGRYLARAQALYRASRTAEPRPVVAAQWAAGRTQIAAQRAQWAEARGRQNGWRAYDEAHAAQQSNYWRPEQDRRRQSAERFAQWRGSDFQGPPPRAVGGERGAAPGGGALRQAQESEQEQRSFPPAAPAPGQRRADEDRGRQPADQPRPIDPRSQQIEPQQRFAQQPADQRRQADDQRRQQAEQQRFAQQEADQRRQADDQHRQQMEQQRFAQQADQRRQADDQRRQQMEPQRFAQQADQRRQADDQRRQQMEPQRQQAAPAQPPQPPQPQRRQDEPQHHAQPQPQAQRPPAPDASRDHERGRDDKPG